MNARIVAGLTSVCFLLSACYNPIQTPSPSPSTSSKLDPKCTYGRLSYPLVKACLKQGCGYVEGKNTIEQIVINIAKGIVPGVSTAAGIVDGVCAIVQNLPAPAPGVTPTPPTYAGVVLTGHFVHP